MTVNRTRHKPLHCTDCRSRIVITVPNQGEYRLECECIEATWDGGWPEKWRTSVTREAF